MIERFFESGLKVRGSEDRGRNIEVGKDGEFSSILEHDILNASIDDVLDADEIGLCVAWLVEGRRLIELAAEDMLKVL